MASQPARTALLSFETPSLQAKTQIWKAIALAERVAAGLILVITLPLLLTSAVVVAVLSKQSPFVAHNRVGQRGRSIWVLKLRTMWEDVRNGPLALLERLQSSCDGDLIPKLPKDPRVKSRFAAACRRYSVDELPQLWNIIRGEMAFVGPRPLTQEEIETHYGISAEQLLSRKPGLTGLWQIRGRSRLSYRQRRRLDMFMLRKWSPGLYVRILLATVPNVLTGKDAF